MILLKRILDWIKIIMSEALEKPVKDNQLRAIYSASGSTPDDGITPPLGTSITQSDYVDTGLTGGAYMLLCMDHFGNFDENDIWYGSSEPHISKYGSGGDGGRVGYYTYTYMQIVDNQLRIVFNHTRWSPYNGNDANYEATVLQLRGN